MRGSRGLGDRGERIALDHLGRRGYTLVERNWRCREGELDLVVRDGEALVFVEVRTRRGEGRGTPEESVTPAKGARLALLAEAYLAERYGDGEPPPCRIDVVGVHLSPSGRLLEVNHVEAAVGF